MFKKKKEKRKEEKRWREKILMILTFAASRKTVSLMCLTPLRMTARATPAANTPNNFNLFFKFFHPRQKRIKI